MSDNFWQVEDLRQLLAAAEERVSGHERRRERALEMGGDEFEAALDDNDRLREENEKLKRFAVMTQKKHGREAERKQRALEAATSGLEERTEECTELRRRLEDEEATSRFLREDLTESKVRASALEKTCAALRSELSDARSGLDSWQEAERIRRQLNAELGHCVRELKILSDATDKLIKVSNNTG